MNHRYDFTFLYEQEVSVAYISECRMTLKHLQGLADIIFRCLRNKFCSVPATALPAHQSTKDVIWHQFADTTIYVWYYNATKNTVSLYKRPKLQDTVPTMVTRTKPHKFTTYKGCLFSEDYLIGSPESWRPLRYQYSWPYIEINDTAELKAALRYGPYTAGEQDAKRLHIGSVFVTAQASTVSHAQVLANPKPYLQATKARDYSDYHIVGQTACKD